MGTPDYMSPEQAIDPRTADIRTDLYSLGCTLYFLLTGQAPFPGGTLLEKVEQHKKQPPPPRGEAAAGDAALRRRPGAATAGQAAGGSLPRRPPSWRRPSRRWSAASARRCRRSRACRPGPAAPVGHALRPDYRSGRHAARPWARWLLAAAATFGLVWRPGTASPCSAARPRRLPTTTSTRTGGFVRIVDAHVPWQDMHLDLRAGDMVTFRASGKWRMSGALPECAADGLAGRAGERNLVPDWPAMCLLARIDGEDIPIALGSHKTVRVKQSGRLFLQANAIDLASCGGSLKVEILGGVRSDREVPGWQFGYGEYEGGVKYFHPLRYYPSHGWQGGLKLPDRQHRLGLVPGRHGPARRPASTRPSAAGWCRTIARSPSAARSAITWRRATA